MQVIRIASTWLQTRFLSLSRMPWFHIVVMIAGIHISQETFAINVLTALKSSSEHRWKHVLRLLQLYGDQS